MAGSAVQMVGGSSLGWACHGQAWVMVAAPVSASLIAVAEGTWTRWAEPVWVSAARPMWGPVWSGVETAPGVPCRWLPCTAELWIQRPAAAGTGGSMSTAP